MKRGKTRRRVARSRFKTMTCDIPIREKGYGHRFIKVTAHALGEWGYHGDLWDIELTQRIWTVFHIASGFKVWSCFEEKEAKIAVKRLHYKVKGRWDLTEEEKYQFHRWYSSLSYIVRKHMRDDPDAEEPENDILQRDRKGPEQYYDDIPF